MSEPELRVSWGHPLNTAEVQSAEVDFDTHASTLESESWQGAPSQTRVYRQIRTDVFEFFTEVRSTAGCWHRILPWNRGLNQESSAQKKIGNSWTPWQRAAVAVCNIGIVLGGCVSGILGGMAIMTFLHLNLFNLNTPVGRNDLALHYYAPVALAVNRIYWGLISLAISSSISRASWVNAVMSASHTGRSLSVVAALESLSSTTWSAIAAACYVLAFVLNISHSALDSELTYAIDRNPSFYTSPLPDPFLQRYQTWRILNSVKSMALLLAWVAVVIEWQPRGLAHLVHQARKIGMATTSIHGQPHRCCGNIRDGAAGASNGRLGLPGKTTQVHTNPAFHESLNNSVPMYPSAGAGIT